MLRPLCTCVLVGAGFKPALRTLSRSVGARHAGAPLKTLCVFWGPRLALFSAFPAAHIRATHASPLPRCRSVAAAFRRTRSPDERVRATSGTVVADCEDAIPAPRLIFTVMRGPVPRIHLFAARQDVDGDRPRQHAL